MQDFNDAPEEEDGDFKAVRTEAMVTRPKDTNYVFMRMTKTWGNVTTESGNVSFTKDDLFFTPCKIAKSFFEKECVELV